jgi:glycosyltransferase involved in cell wall biosynthesis
MNANSLTVLMPVYNAEKYLREAIDSILNQHFSEFEFVIINDGSTDKSEEIIRSYTDPRIKYYKNEVNSGIVKTLNKGLDLIHSEYIVRMDSDDISLPDRLSIQKKFMDDHPEVGVSSSYYEIFGNENQIIQLASESDVIKAYLIFGSQICHPAAIIRTSVLKNNNLHYSSAFPHMEDYDLWYRLKDLTNFGNIRQVLLKYRVTGENVTVRNYDTILERKFAFYKSILQPLDIDLSKNDFYFHNAFDTDKSMPVKDKIVGYRNWLDKLILKNTERKVFPETELKGQIDLKWRRVFYEVVDVAPKDVITFWKASKKIKIFEIIYLMKYGVRKMMTR